VSYVYLVILLMLVEYLFMGYFVSRARTRFKFPAPATTGHPEFERYLRVQQNTVEQLIVVIPALWIFAVTLNPSWAALLGAVFIVGRAIYAWGYIQAPAQRHYGYMIGFVPMIVLLVGAFLGVVKAMLLAG
jgi:glutathione S-transferase